MKKASLRILVFLLSACGESIQIPIQKNVDQPSVTMKLQHPASNRVRILLVGIFEVCQFLFWFIIGDDQ